MTNYEENKFREDAKYLLAMYFLIMTDIADAIKRNDYDAMSTYSEDLGYLEIVANEEFQKDYQKLVERLAYFDDDSKERLVNELPDYLEK